MPRNVGLIIGVVLTCIGFFLLDIGGKAGILLAIPSGALFGAGIGVFIYFWKRKSARPPRSDENTTEL